MRPFFPYYGSQWSKAASHPAPEHRLVIEPFAGAAGYATYYSAPRAILYDKDPVIAGLWSYLLAVTPQEIMALPELPEVGDSVDNYALPQEAKWLIGFWLNRGSATPKKSRTAYSARTDRAQMNWGHRAKERVASQLGAIAGWSIANRSYETAPNVEATWFVDPPYVDKGRYYRTAFNGHPALGEWCLGRRGLLIACEAPGATWLPFVDLGSFKSSKGRASEVSYVQRSHDASRLELIFNQMLNK